MNRLYSDMKIFHFPEKLYSLERDTPITGPLHLRIKPTNVCNHRCYYCCFRTPEAGPMGQTMEEKDSLAKDTLLEIITDFKDMGGRAITFSGGGEPFVYPYLLAAVEHAAQLNLSFAALTNGARLHGAVANFFAQHGTWVRISMDGWDDASYSQYRGTAHGEYQKIMQNMADFVQYEGPCALSVAYNIDKNNYTHIPKVLRDLKERGVRSVQLTACIVNTCSQKQKEYHSLFYTEAEKIIISAQTNLAGPHFEIKDNYTTVDAKYDNALSWCPFQQILAVIGADARVYTCQHKAYSAQGLLGDLSHQRFKNLWLNSKDTFFSIVPSRDCDHFCVAHQKNKLILDFLAVSKQHINFV